MIDVETRAGKERAVHSSAINSHFEHAAGYWAEIYERTGVNDLVHQERLRIMLDAVADLRLPAGARVLDVGCGAGLAAVDLAKSGYLVDAIDPVQAMIDSTCRRAAAEGVATRVRATLGDIDAIPFADGTFALAGAMGVLPWLPSIDQALREMHRVLQPNGYLIISVDNRWSLCRWFDPSQNPVLTPAKELAKRILVHFGYERDGVPSYSISDREFGSLLSLMGFEKLQSITLGFGPFTLLRRELLPAGIGVKIHRIFQRFADSGVGFFRAAGMQSIILATKRP
jgi:SAM-dependent methyltransferase